MSELEELYHFQRDNFFPFDYCQEMYLLSAESNRKKHSVTLLLLIEKDCNPPRKPKTFLL